MKFEEESEDVEDTEEEEEEEDQSRLKVLAEHPFF